MQETITEKARKSLDIIEANLANMQGTRAEHDFLKQCCEDILAVIAALEETGQGEAD